MTDTNVKYGKTLFRYLEFIGRLTKEGIDADLAKNEPSFSFLREFVTYMDHIFEDVDSQEPNDYTDGFLKLFDAITVSASIIQTRKGKYWIWKAITHHPDEAMSFLVKNLKLIK